MRIGSAELVLNIIITIKYLRTQPSNSQMVKHHLNLPDPMQSKEGHRNFQK